MKRRKSVSAGISTRHGVDSAADLMTGNSQITQGLLDPKVFRMKRVGIQRFLRVELGIQQHIAGIVDSTVVDTDLQRQQARNQPAQGLELSTQEIDVPLAFRTWTATDVPHDDVLNDHGCQAGKPAFCGQRLTNAWTVRLA